MKNTVIPVLFAGLGNKFGSLFSGFILSKRLNKQLYIVNVNCSYVSLNLKSIFNFNYDYIDVSSFDEIDKYIDTSIPVYTSNKFNFTRPCLQHVDINTSNCLDSFLYLNHRGILPSKDDLLSFFKKFNINDDIKNKINYFAREYQIDKNVYGLHVRASDFPFRDRNIPFAKQFIESNRDKRIFVCTDELEVEKELCQYNNVFVRNKPVSSYTKKINDSESWNVNYTHPVLKSNMGNSFRDIDSSVEGFIDMILLSKSNLNSNMKDSTFFKWASIFSNIDFN